MIQSTVHQRLNIILEQLGNSNMSELARRVGVRSGVITDMFGKRQNKPSFDLLVKFANAFPQLRLEWLVSGEGEMLKSDISDAQDQNNPSYTAPGQEEIIAHGPLVDQPYVDLPAPDFRTLAHFGQQPGLNIDSFRNSPTLRLYLRPDEMPEKYIGAMVVTIFGDSMEPELHDGERMVVWFIPEGKWEQIHNTVCVVAYEDTVTIKGIAENDLYENNRLKLRAANPPTSYYVVGRDKINSIWEVREYYDRPKYTPSFIRRYVA